MHHTIPYMYTQSQRMTQSYLFALHYAPLKVSAQIYARGRQYKLLSAIFIVMLRIVNIPNKTGPSVFKLLSFCFTSRFLVNILLSIIQCTMHPSQTNIPVLIPDWQANQEKHVRTAEPVRTGAKTNNTFN